MKILFVLHGLDSGGAEHQTVNQINRLWEMGFHVQLAVLSTKKSLLPNLKIPAENIHVLDVPKIAPFTTLTAWNGMTKCAPRMWQLVRNQEFTHVIANLLQSHYVMRLVAFLEIFRGGKRFKLINYHRSLTYDVHGFQSIGERVYIWFNNLMALFFDDKNLFISGAVEKSIRKGMPVHEGHVIHNSIPEKSVGVELASQYLADKGLTFNHLSVVPGRLHPVKGHDFLLNSTAEIWLDDSNFQGKKPLLVFAGGGKELPALQAQIEKLGLADRVHITGVLENDLMLSFMALADLVLIPSRFEGFGNVAIEAMMQGATILASDAGGLPEILRDGENGHLFQKENADSLRQKLRSVLVSGQKFSPEKLRSEFQKRFTLDAQLAHLLEVIK